MFSHTLLAKFIANKLEMYVCVLLKCGNKFVPIVIRTFAQIPVVDEEVNDFLVYLLHLGSKLKSFAKTSRWHINRLLDKQTCI